MAKEVKEGHCELPNGSWLYWRVEPATNARYYFSDEIGGGVRVWDTALVDDGTLLAALTNEARLKVGEYHLKEEVNLKAIVIGRRMAEAVNDVVEKVAKKREK